MSNNKKSNFIEKWKACLSGIFSPGAIFFLFLTGGSLFISFIKNNDIVISSIMAVIASITSAFAGSFLKDEMDRVSGKNILEKKGWSALRNLQGISSQLCHIREWIAEFEKETKKEDKRNLEEIKRHISTIELSISSGLKDWVDIIPELTEEIENKEEMNKKVSEVIRAYQREVLDLRKAIISSKSKDEVSKLKKNIGDLERQMNDIRIERNQAIHLNGGFADPLTVAYNPVNYVSAAAIVNKKCSKCGNEFEPDYINIDATSLCPKCRGYFNFDVINK